MQLHVLLVKGCIASFSTQHVLLHSMIGQDLGFT